MSIGPAKHEDDKAGKRCVVYDAVFNPRVVKDAQNDETGKKAKWTEEKEEEKAGRDDRKGDQEELTRTERAERESRKRYKTERTR